MVVKGTGYGNGNGNGSGGGNGGGNGSGNGYGNGNGNPPVVACYETSDNLPAVMLVGMLLQGMDVNPGLEVPYQE